MKVAYQHMNPHEGRESVLVRFHDELHDQVACVLVDAGTGVDVDDALAGDEYLSAILLTHAHLDHYRTLGANLQDSAPIYATPETAATIRARLGTAADHVQLENGDEILAAMQPVTGWEEITADIRIRPVPAGHAPGACGFLLEFADDQDRYRLLATGDFTTRRAGGYPGLPTDIDVGAVFLTAATAEDFTQQLTAAVATIVQRANAGSTVLATASGSTGVHLAYLLAHLGERLHGSLPVRLTGRVATLWEAYGYDHPHVEPIPTFADPETVLGPGSVAIAGPEVPVGGSSERLFGAIETDAGGTLVQVTNGAFDTISSATCTVLDYELRNHPSEATIDAVVESLAPIHVVVTHQQGPAADRYKDKYDSFVWATDDRRRYTIYEGGNWTGPPWVTEATRRRVRTRLYTAGDGAIGTGIDYEDVPVPAVERHEDVDLDAEGLDMERLRDELGVELFDGDSRPAPDAGETDEGDVGVATGSGSRISSATDPAGHRTGTGEPAAGSAATTGGVDLAEISEQLARIEAALGRSHTRARVVDAGEDVTLLRVTDESLSTALSHGQSVGLTVHGVGDAVSDGSTSSADAHSRSNRGG